MLATTGIAWILLMSKRSTFLSPYPKEVSELHESSILRRLQKEKRGLDCGKSYKPFLTVRDAPSKALHKSRFRLAWYVSSSRIDQNIGLLWNRKYYRPDNRFSS